MPCIMEPPSIKQEEWLEHMLCKSCQYLTKEQINSIDGLDCYIGLGEWYIQHLMNDFGYYNKIHDRNKYHNKDREGLLSPFPDEEYIKKQIKRCIDESKKMGYKIEIKGTSIITEYIKS